ncbi:MAG: ArnT family glycosyltransferase [Holosporales bacterium]|jgi:4-amino-4-deoxy-L-arabinose transferase-like glycosyltransferase
MNSIALPPLSVRALWVALVLLCAVLYLPGQHRLPVMDRDEARFAQATKQMLATEDYIDIRFQHESRYKKPVGIYWLQAMSVRFVGTPEAIWAYRLPSLFSAIGTVLLLAWLVLRLGETCWAALAAGAMLASTVLLSVEAHLAKTDAALLLVVTGVQAIILCQYQAWQTGKRLRRHWIVVWWALLGIGILLKGPIVPLIAGLSLAWLKWIEKDRGFAKTFWDIWGLGLAIVIVLPWLVLIHQVSGGGFWREAVVNDLLSKAVSGQESHGAPPLFYAALSPLLLWPFGGAVLLALLRVRQHRNHFVVRAALAWVVPTWVLFELIPTKLPHYILPTFPALVLLTVWVWRREGERLLSPGHGRATLRFFYGIFGVGLTLAPVIAVPLALGNELNIISLFPALVATTFMIIAIQLGTQLPIRFGALVLGAALTYTSLFHLHVPAAQRLWVSERLLTALKEAGVQHRPLAIAGFNEPSAVFTLGTDLRLTNGVGAAAFLVEYPDGIVMIESRQRAAFDAVIRSLRSPMPLTERGQVTGLNYSNGKTVDIHILEASEP